MSATDSSKGSERTPSPPHAGDGGRYWALIGIFLLLAVATLDYAEAFLMPVAMGLLLTLVFTPVRRFLGRFGVPNALASFLIVAVLMVGLLAGVALLAEPIQEWVDDAPTLGILIDYKLQKLIAPAQAVIEAGEQVQKIVSQDDDEASVPAVAVREQSIFSQLAWQAPGIVGQASVTLVLLLLLLASGDLFHEKIVNALPTLKDKRQAVAIFHDIESKLSRYLFTITLINASLGTAIGVAMALLGMPDPVLYGVMAFVFNYVPYLGAVAGSLLTTIAGLASLEGVWPGIAAGAAYMSLTALEGYFITPYFVGRSLKLNTVIVFLAVVFGAWLWSVVGMILAVPLLMTVKVFCEHFAKLEALGRFLSAREAANGENGSSQGAARPAEARMQPG